MAIYTGLFIYPRKGSWEEILCSQLKQNQHNTDQCPLSSLRSSLPLQGSEGVVNAGLARCYLSVEKALLLCQRTLADLIIQDLKRDRVKETDTVDAYQGKTVDTLVWGNLISVSKIEKFRNQMVPSQQAGLCLK